MHTPGYHQPQNFHPQFTKPTSKRNLCFNKSLPPFNHPLPTANRLTNDNIHCRIQASSNQLHNKQPFGKRNTSSNIRHGNVYTAPKSRGWQASQWPRQRGSIARCLVLHANYCFSFFFPQGKNPRDSLLKEHPLRIPPTLVLLLSPRNVALNGGPGAFTPRCLRIPSAPRACWRLPSPPPPRFPSLLRPPPAPVLFRFLLLSQLPRRGPSPRFFSSPPRRFESCGDEDLTRPGLLD